MSLGASFNGQADGYRQLWQAVDADDGTKITALIEAGANPNQGLNEGVSLLHRAAQNARLQALKALIAGGADIHKLDKDNHSVLRAALRAKSLEGVEALMQAGADPYNMSYDDKDGRNASDTTFAIGCDWDIAGAVHKVADRFFVNQVVNSPHREDVKGLEQRLGFGDVPADTLDRHGKSALIHACERGYADCARVLLAHGADPNFPDRDGRLPIHILATCQNPAMVQQLVAAGARLTAKDSKGYTALELAQKAGNEPMAAALEQAVRDFTTSATAAGEGLRAMKTLKFKPPAS